MLTRDDVDAAAKRIAAHVRRTPVLAADARRAVLRRRSGGSASGCSTPARSRRGGVQSCARRRGDGELDRSVGVIAASGGNAGLAVAYAAAHLGVPAEIWVPTTAPPVKVARLRSLGATVVGHGAEYAEAYQARSTGSGDRRGLLPRVRPRRDGRRCRHDRAGVTGPGARRLRHGHRRGRRRWTDGRAWRLRWNPSAYGSSPPSRPPRPRCTRRSPPADRST